MIACPLMCEQVKDLVKPFGELKSFNLLKDPEGNPI
jgi:hypothetical protein